MHLPDGFIDAPVSVGALLVAGPVVALAARRAGQHLVDRDIPLAGLVTAYLVVAQLLVFPIGLGTSGHLVGAGLALVLVGPSVAITCTTIVLVLQALLFADGGVSALGLNALNSGIVPILAAWAVLATGNRLTGGRPATRNRSAVDRKTGSIDDNQTVVEWADGPAPASAGSAPSRVRPPLVGLAAGIGVLAGAAVFCAEYALGSTATLDAADVTRAMLGTHVVVGAVEGTLTALLVGALLRVRPDLVGRWMRRPDAARRRAGRSGVVLDDRGAMSGGHAHTVDPAKPLDGPVQRLAPEAKILGTLAFVLAVVATPGRAVWAHVLLGLLAGGVAVVVLVPVRVLARRLVFEIPVVALALAMVAFGDGPTVAVGPFGLSAAGLWSAWTVLVRATLGVIAASVLAASTTAADLVTGLERLHLPRVVTAIAAFAVRYIAVLRDELDRMRLAQSLRAAGRRVRPTEVAMLGAVLFVRAFERGERVHASMVTRGGGTPEPGRAAPTPARQWCTALAPAVAAATVALVAWGAA